MGWHLLVVWIGRDVMLVDVLGKNGVLTASILMNTWLYRSWFQFVYLYCEFAEYVNHKLYVVMVRRHRTCSTVCRLSSGLDEVSNVDFRLNYSRECLISLIWLVYIYAANCWQGCRSSACSRVESHLTVSEILVLNILHCIKSNLHRNALRSLSWDIRIISQDDERI